ncbi:MAG TPA: NAD-dependent epimerase/dehydratase family protein [Solirubrobacterales bacterium]|nr:NAD-dependent epimerase/dehydratase family protein [Solirubrobacterales bacterium]
MANGHLVVTGAAGFIGSHLSRRLRAEGLRVVGIDSLASPTPASLIERRLEELGRDPGFDLVELDLNETSPESLLKNADAIFHLAGRPGVRDSNERLLWRHNVAATRALLEAAERGGVTDLVFASSSSIYGRGGERRPCHEDDRPEPISAYGRSKLAAESLLRRSSLNTRVLRLFTVYGPQQRSDMAFARFLDSALSQRPTPLFQGVEAERDFTYVEDAVEGVLRAWRRVRQGTYNLSGGMRVPLRAPLAILSKLVGAPVVLEAAVAPPEPNATEADLSRARATLDYEPRTPLRIGLREQALDAFAQFRAHPIAGQDTPKADYAGMEQENIRPPA